MSIDPRPDANDAALGAPLIAAATVIVLRPRPSVRSPGLEILMLQRNRGGNFGGAWVFPGGKIDPGDSPDNDDDPVRADARAASRECLEEASVEVSPGELIRWSHWTPPVRAGVRFSTSFFVAIAPSALHAVTVDGAEIVRYSWMTPAEIFAAHEAGKMELAPPTFITVCQLGDHGTVDSAISAAGQPSVEHFETRIAVTETDVLALYHGDVAYETLDPDSRGHRHRLVMRRAGDERRTVWTYQRDPETRPT